MRRANDPVLRELAQKREQRQKEWAEKVRSCVYQVLTYIYIYIYCMYMNFNLLLAPTNHTTDSKYICKGGKGEGREGKGGASCAQIFFTIT